MIMGRKLLSFHVIVIAAIAAIAMAAFYLAYYIKFDPFCPFLDSALFPDEGMLRRIL